jgi:DNA-directed RNA polymerase specialized sigma24 family protein
MIPGVLEPEKFEKLLAWLNPDRDVAGQRYESIRSRLIKIFHARGCYQAEEMADETMDRVVKKIDTLCGRYEGEPALYFYAVAKNVFLEFTRAPKTTELQENLVQPSDDADPDDEAYHKCLEECLAKLSAGQREFIVDFHKYVRAEKIEKRKKMAETLGISAQALRIRAFRIRESLRKCISICVADA